MERRGDFPPGHKRNVAAAQSEYYKTMFALKTKSMLSFFNTKGPRPNPQGSLPMQAPEGATLTLLSYTVVFIATGLAHENFLMDCVSAKQEVKAGWGSSTQMKLSSTLALALFGQHYCQLRKWMVGEML